MLNKKRFELFIEGEGERKVNLVTNRCCLIVDTRSYWSALKIMDNATQPMPHFKPGENTHAFSLHMVHVHREVDGHLMLNVNAMKTRTSVNKIMHRVPSQGCSVEAEMV